MTESGAKFITLFHHTFITPILDWFLWRSYWVSVCACVYFPPAHITLSIIPEFQISIQWISSNFIVFCHCFVTICKNIQFVSSSKWNHNIECLIEGLMTYFNIGFYILVKIPAKCSMNCHLCAGGCDAEHTKRIIDLYLLLTLMANKLNPLEIVHNM